MLTFNPLFFKTVSCPKNEKGPTLNSRTDTECFQSLAKTTQTLNHVKYQIKGNYNYNWITYNDFFNNIYWTYSPKGKGQIPRSSIEH